MAEPRINHALLCWLSAQVHDLAAAYDSDEGTAIVLAIAARCQVALGIDAVPSERTDRVALGIEEPEAGDRTQMPVPSHRWLDETEIALARPDARDNKWLQRFAGALREITRLRALAERQRGELDARAAVDIPTLAMLLRGLQTMPPRDDSGAAAWEKLDAQTRERWLAFATYVADGVERLRRKR